MSIGITNEHVALRDAVRGWTERHGVTAAARSVLDAEVDCVPAFWPDLSGRGWLSLHLAECHGGSGFGLLESAVVLEELGRAVAPGPALPTVLAGALVQHGGDDALAQEVLPGLATGDVVGAVVLPGECSLEVEAADKRLCVRGTFGPTLGLHLADVVIAPVGGTDGSWCVLERAQIMTRSRPSIDSTRRVADGSVRSARVPRSACFYPSEGRVEHLIAVLVAAELVGIADWCVTTAALYARHRVQFGRPIGQFQAVKHRCADMLCRLEVARAAVWDATQISDDDVCDAFAGTVALGLALDAAFENAKDCVQVLGGVGFSWEHDAHLYLKRAMELRSLFGPASSVHGRAGRLALAGVRRRRTFELGERADSARRDARAFLSEIREVPPLERPTRVAAAGYVMPGWPVPWGRGASAAEQLVIDEEFANAGVDRVDVLVGRWALPPVIQHGTRPQQERWIAPTLRGEIVWCQLFSEPDAGSDLASLSTVARRVDGGWSISGQKIWSSMADFADWGILLARTAPDAPKHDGISCFMLDMKRSTGLEVRPLRELTGDRLFNEVFLSDVFVPDDCLVGDPDDGWRVARTTLANERVYMGSGITLGRGLEAILQSIAQDDAPDDYVVTTAGIMVSTAHALASLGFRQTLLALDGTARDSEAAVRKLLGALHDQELQQFGLELLGSRGAVLEGEAADWSRDFLFNRSLTIAGGTSEIQRNIIAERMLDLPRDS